MPKNPSKITVYLRKRNPTINSQNTVYSVYTGCFCEALHALWILNFIVKFNTILCCIKLQEFAMKFHQDVSLGIPPGVSPGDSSRSCSWGFSQALFFFFLKAFPLETPPGVRVVDSYRSSLRRLLQEIHLRISHEAPSEEWKFLQGITPGPNFGDSSGSIPSGVSFRGFNESSHNWFYFQKLH